MQRFCTADFKLFLLNGVKFSRRMKQIKSITACYENKTISTETANYISVTIDPEYDGKKSYIPCLASQKTCSIFSFIILLFL